MSYLPRLATAALGLVMAACSTADDHPNQMGDQLSIHDPVMIREDGTYYLFSTGPGITIYRSDDMREWVHQGRAVQGEPEWADTVAPGFNGHLWAPDIVEKDGDYYLYYSVSAFGKNTSAMGLTITETLDPNSPDYGWEDQGIVLRSVPNRDDWNAIDPAVIVDDEGTPWMSFGSFWDGLKMFKLNDDWDGPAEPPVWHTIARGERPAFTPDTDPGSAELEAPFIFEKGDYYYLFISLGKCCRGLDSTYHLAVGRSESATGPYVDRSGKDLAKGGGTVILEGNEDWTGLGHNSAYTFDGTDYLVFHAYEAADEGLQKLKILPIEWDNGWPTVDPAGLDSFQSEVVESLD